MQLKAASSDVAVSFVAVTKSYETTDYQLGPLSLEIKSGELVALIGPSGSGKSTLLKSINGLIDITSGTVTTCGQVVNELKGRELRKFRSKVAIVFQDFGVLPRLTALETVLTGALGRLRFPRLGIASYPKRLRMEAVEVLNRVGLAGLEFQRVGQLSGGQIQRVAIARALFQNPEVLLLDEPISSLDPENSRLILDLVSKLAAENNLTVVASLHQVDWASKWPDRVIGLKAGQMVIDKPSSATNLSQLKAFYEK